MQIDINDQTEKLSKAQSGLLMEVLQFAATTEEVVETAELSVSIVSNTEIKQLNATYRDKDVATDVLSFPMEDAFTENEQGMPVMIGDIIISIEKVKEQADKYNHSADRELLFLAVHGLLHIVGYSHDTSENEREMFSKQEDILREFNLERT